MLAQGPQNTSQVGWASPRAHSTPPRLTGTRPCTRTCPDEALVARAAISPAAAWRHWHGTSAFPHSFPPEQAVGWTFDSEILLQVPSETRHHAGPGQVSWHFVNVAAHPPLPPPPPSTSTLSQTLKSVWNELRQRCSHRPSPYQQADARSRPSGARIQAI